MLSKFCMSELLVCSFAKEDILCHFTSLWWQCLSQTSKSCYGRSPLPYDILPYSLQYLSPQQHTEENIPLWWYVFLRGGGGGGRSIAGQTNNPLSLQPTIVLLLLILSQFHALCPFLIPFTNIFSILPAYAVETVDMTLFLNLKYFKARITNPAYNFSLFSTSRIRTV